MTFNRRRVFAGLFAEVSFTTLPLLIMLIVLLNYEHGEHIVQSPEWSFGAAILFGLAPSLLVLTLVLIDMEAIPRREPAEWLSVLQVVLFLLGAATYLVFGTVGELWRHHETIAVVERGRS